MDSILLMQLAFWITWIVALLCLSACGKRFVEFAGIPSFECLHESSWPVSVKISRDTSIQSNNMDTISFQDKFVFMIDLSGQCFYA